MHFTTTIVSALAMLMAGQAVAAAVAVPAENDLLVRAAEIATSREAACRCPNNCSHKKGSSCKYKAGTSTDGSTVSGTCDYKPDGSGLWCVPK